MAILNSLKKHDDYMTPNYVWDDLQKFIPNDKVIWEAFYGDGSSGNYLRKLGFSVIHEPVDFFSHNHGDIIVSNPPFSKKQMVFERLKKLGKPFMILAPVSTLNTQYLKKLYGKEKIQLIIPDKRINFIKLVNGEIPENWGSRCNFDVVFFCWKMNLTNDINFNARPHEKTR